MTNRSTLPRAGLWACLRLHLLDLPGWLIGGAFTDNPRGNRWLARRGFEPFHRTGALLRARHPGPGVSTRVLFRRTLVLHDPAAIAEVLDHSPLDWADPGLKRRGMTVFQPDALTISRGRDWQQRRAFADAVLSPATFAPLHERWRSDIAELVASRPPRDWQDFSSLGQRLAQRVFFGAEAPAHLRAVQRLQQGMRRANRIITFGAWRGLPALHGHLRQVLQAPAPGSLMALAAQAIAVRPGQQALQDPERQLVHWLFALASTLPIQVARALVLLGSGPAEPPPDNRQAAAAVREAARLWPTTRVLSREAVRGGQVAGHAVQRGTQVLLLNSALARDSTRTADANSFRPNRWQDSGAAANYQFNAFSNGSQVCPGRDLALVLAGELVAHLLGRWAYRPASPVDLNAVPMSHDHQGVHFHLTPR